MTLALWFILGSAPLTVYLTLHDEGPFDAEEGEPQGDAEPF